MADLYITQEEYDDLVEELVLKVADDHYDFDTIICLARGGMRVGDVFSRVHDMPLAILAANVVCMAMVFIPLLVVAGSLMRSDDQA